MTERPTDDSAAVVAAHEIQRRMTSDLRALTILALRPTALSEQVRTWRLYSGEEYGGVYCAQPDCGCEGHGSEIIAGEWHPAEGEEPETFTLDQLYAAITEHIEYRDERRAEDADDGQ